MTSYSDELRYIEQEAREDGEREWMAECKRENKCPECGGEGRLPNPYCTGDQAGGYADTCDTCDGEGTWDAAMDAAAYAAEQRREGREL